jgi:glutamyl-tRNA reductase
MKLQVVGCSHHSSTVEIRERLAFNPEQVRRALQNLRTLYPETEAVLLSTCNRVELYVASENGERCPTHHDVVSFLAEFHGLQASDVFNQLFEHTGEDFVRHLFTVAASLDSMVVGEAQILGQVKQAYELAQTENSVGTLTNAAFQSALRVAKRVASETAIQQRRVSIPSVAVVDFAKQFFERFDDKQVLIIGAGDMAEETVRYLLDEGARHMTLVNRNRERAEALAEKMGGQVMPWEKLTDLLVTADLVVSTTGAMQPIVTVDHYREIEQRRFQRPLFILDLAVPRDFEPTIGNFTGVYLCSVDDLHAACDRNRKEREKEWPRAERIIEEETARFMTDLHHRATGPTIKRLKNLADNMKQEELVRLMNKLGPTFEDKARQEIERSFDRLINKLLHPPLESLRDEASQGQPHGLLEALKRLFRLSD